MSAVTEREKGLLVGAALVLLATFYIVGRVQPLRADLKRLREEVTGMEQRLANTPMPRPPADPDAVHRQLDEAETRLTGAREELAVLLQRRVDPNSNQALEGLMLEILTLAKAKGVSVDASGVYAGSLAELGVVSREETARLQGGSDSFQFRPLRNLSLRGDFPAIRGFVEELPRLGHPVSVLHFSLKAERGATERQRAGGLGQSIRAELVIAL